MSNATSTAVPDDTGWQSRSGPRPMSLRLRLSLVLTALAAALVLAGAAMWVRDARIAIAEEVTAANRVAAQWLGAAARGAAEGDPAWSEERLIAHLTAVGRIRAHHLEARDPVGRVVYLAPMGDFPLYLDLFAARHGFGKDGYYVMRRRWDYFVQHLLGAEPPKQYEIKVPAP